MDVDGQSNVDINLMGMEGPSSVQQSLKTPEKQDIPQYNTEFQTILAAFSKHIHAI